MYSNSERHRKQFSFGWRKALLRAMVSVLHLRMSLLFRRKEFNVGWSWYRVFLRWFVCFSHSCIKWAPSEIRSIDTRNSDFIYVTKSLTESAGLFKSSLAIVKPPGSCMKAGFSNRKKMRFPIDFRMGIHIALWICFFFFRILNSLWILKLSVSWN